MPLTKSQKESIELSVEHFFMFSENAAEFISEVNNIMHILTAEKPDPNNDYAHLYECFHDPASRLNGIERCGAQISIGEIQQCIINFASQCIKEAAEKCRRIPPPKSVGRDQEKMDRKTRYDAYDPQEEKRIRLA